MDDNQIVIQKLDSLEKQIKILIQKIDNLDKSCSRMDGHIEFVEKTYDVLRSPLNLLTSMSSRFYGSVEDDNVLPQLENKS
jgi:hypothetical protein